MEASRAETSNTNTHTHLLQYLRQTQDSTPSPAIYTNKNRGEYSKRHSAVYRGSYPAYGILEITSLVMDTVFVSCVLQKLDFLEDVLPFLHAQQTNTHTYLTYTQFLSHFHSNKDNYSVIRFYSRRLKIELVMG